LGFVVGATVLVAARPSWVSDQNTFLADFVGAQFLSLLGVILAITLASVANIHLEINKIEEHYQTEGMDRTRRNLRKNANWLIGLFVAGVAITIIKPLLGGPTGEGVANMAALFILLWHVLILVSLTELVFKIPPLIKR
jgi:hypothetical protein